MRVARTALAVAISSLLSLPALAAEAPPPADATTLDRIVVTGEKSQRSLQDTTTSVAVTTSVRIEQENLQTLYEVFNRTANVAQTYGDAGFTIRGIRDTDGGGAAPLATIYLDGAALPQSVVSSGPTNLWDLSQVEILRGPQSTIQGENALAGAIVLRTADPTMDWEGKARALASDPSDRNLAFAFGGPLLEDELAFRVAAEHRSFDGYNWNVTREAPDDSLETTQYRAKLLWTPKAIEGLQVRLGYTQAQRTGPYQFNYVRSDVPDWRERRISTADYPDRGRTDADVANLEIDYAINDAWSLSAATAWNKVHTLRGYDGDRTADPISYGEQDVLNRTFSQEVRANYDGERLDGLVGLYYSRHDDRNDASSRTNVNTPVGTISALLQGAGFPAAAATQIAGAYAQVLPVIPVDYASTTPTRSENRALFADGSFQVAGGFSLIGGFRYDRQRYELASDTQATFVGQYPNPAAFGAPGTPLYLAVAAINQGVAGLVDSAAGSVPQSTRDFTAFLPKGGVRYEWSPDLSASFVVQRGYRSGGSSFNIARSQTVAYDPEYTWNYEGSLRSQWLDGRLTLNANAYYVDWKDKQVIAYFGLNDYDYNTVNAGRAHLYGFEVEASHRVNPGFDWYGSVGYSRTRYDEFQTVMDAQITDYSGQEFAYAPHWTAAVGGNFRFAESWVANLNANYRDKVYTDVGAAPTQLASRTLVNGRFGYETLDWSAWIFANNLFDVKYVQYRWSDDPVAILGAPRSVGIGFQANW